MSDRGQAQERHVPVMRDRILELLAPALQRPGAVHIDGTLGMGGHAEGVLERFPECIVVGIDRDREALALAGERLARFGDRFRPVHAPLDMRMDQSTGPTAGDVLNTYSEQDLTRILRDYGEERFARKIARAVVHDREIEPYTSSARLVEMLRRVIPAASQRQS